MKTENGRKVRYFFKDHSADELKDYLETIFPAGKITEEEADDLCTIIGQLEEMVRAAEGAYQERYNAHAKQIEAFRSEMERELKIFRGAGGIFEVVALLILAIIVFSCQNKYVVIFFVFCIPTLVVLVNRAFERACKKREEALACEKRLIKCYNSKCLAEKRSLDIVPIKPAENIDKWYKQADVVWEFVKTRNPYDERIGI